MNDQATAQTGLSDVAPGRITRRPQHRFQPEASYRPGSNPSLLSMLSVMVLTLAFFVVLNSISRVEPEKSMQVLESIDETFGTFRAADMAISPAGAAATDVAQALQRVFDPMESLAPDVAKVRRAKAESVEFRFPAAWLFPGQRAQLSATAIGFIGEVRRLLGLRPAHWRYEMEMALIAPSPGDIDFERAASLAAALIASDAPDGMASVSVSPGGMDEIAILITLHPPAPATPLEAIAP